MNLIKKFKPALHGLKYAWLDHSIRLQIIIAIIVVGITIPLHLDSIAYLALFSAIALVIITETINTAIERLCDYIQDQHDPKIGTIKDLSAAFVLMAALYAILIAIWIIMHTWF